MSCSVLLESDMKVRLADLLINQEMHDVVFATEVPFADAARRADFLCINGKVTAFEIKSDVDKVDNIGRQIQDYRQCFDEVYAVTTATHLKTIRNLIPRSVGLILVEEHSASIIRNARQNMKFNKLYLASFLCRAELIRLLATFQDITPAVRKLSVFELRKYTAQKVSMKNLKTMSLHKLKEKYRGGHTTFVKHRGQYTHSEDLLYLGLTQNVIP